MLTPLSPVPVDGVTSGDPISNSELLCQRDQVPCGPLPRTGNPRASSPSLPGVVSMEECEWDVDV